MRALEIELSLDDLRAVTSFAAACATSVLPVYDTARADDDRPRLAVLEATTFAHGGRRTQALRATAVAAHRAAREVQDAAHHAAMAAGDAAASAYLHPLADAAQVGHILRAAAHAVMASPGEWPRVVDELLHLADDHLRSVLARYPRTGPGSSDVTRLVHHLDERLRA